VSPPGVEKIGLAKQAEVEATASARTSESSAEIASAASGRPGTSAADEPPAQKRRVHPILLAVLLVGLAGLAVAFANQLQRAQELEGKVAFLGAELDRAHDELAVHEQKMEGVRSAVSDLTQRMSALQTLVNEPPRPLDTP
jgi:uncharacterized coiled-coil protein SlyX